MRTWRYAVDGTADVARRSGRDRCIYPIVQRGQPAAVGFEAVVDAVEVTVRPPESLEADPILAILEELGVATHRTENAL